MSELEARVYAQQRLPPPPPAAALPQPKFNSPPPRLQPLGKFAPSALDFPNAPGGQGGGAEQYAMQLANVPGGNMQVGTPNISAMEYGQQLNAMRQNAYDERIAFLEMRLESELADLKSKQGVANAELGGALGELQVRGPRRPRL